MGKPPNAIRVPISEEECRRLIESAPLSGFTVADLKITMHSRDIEVTPTLPVGNWTLNALAQMRGLDMSRPSVSAPINPLTGKHTPRPLVN